MVVLMGNSHHSLRRQRRPSWRAPSSRRPPLRHNLLQGTGEGILFNVLSTQCLIVCLLVEGSCSYLRNQPRPRPPPWMGPWWPTPLRHRPRPPLNNLQENPGKDFEYRLLAHLHRTLISNDTAVVHVGILLAEGTHRSRSPQRCPWRHCPWWGLLWWGPAPPSWPQPPPS